MESERQEVRSQLDHVVAVTLRPLSLAFGLFISYNVYNGIQSESGMARVWIVGADVVVAVYLLGLAAWLWLRPPPLRAMEPLAASVAIALAGTDMVTMAIRGSVPDLPATVLVLAGIGIVGLSWAWVLGAQAIIWSAWLMLTGTGIAVGNADFILRIATLIGVTALAGRRVAYRQLITARLRESRARDALASVNEELDRFAAVVAHDLKNPVSAIRLKAATIRHRLAGDDSADESLRELDHIAQNMGRLVDDVLAYARAGGAAPAQDIVDLDSVLQEVREVYRTEMERLGGTLEVAHLPPVRGDATQLRQLFQNLVGNALAHRLPDKPPIVRIGAERAPDAVAVRVADNGPGFDPDEAKRISRPFERGDTQAPGHGLGLATCRRIVDHLGGRIEASSKPGQGAVFTVTLPPASGRPPRPSPEHEAPHAVHR